MRSLTLALNEIDDANALEDLVRLEELDLSDNRLGAKGNASIAGLSRLTKLSFFNLAGNPTPNGEPLVCPVREDVCLID